MKHEWLFLYATVILSVDICYIEPSIIKQLHSNLLCKESCALGNLNGGSGVKNLPWNAGV